MVEVPSLELTTSFLMANLCPTPPFCSLPFHKALPKTCLIFSYNFPRLRHRHFHTVFASSVKKAGTSKKVMNNADLCKNIREFVDAFGFPEGHVPSMKELSQHGRQDLANIVRRRGYKMLRDLLETSAETEKNEFDTKESFTTEQGEKVEDNADDIVNEQGEKVEGNANDIVNEQGEKVRDLTQDILLQSGIHGMRDVVEDVSMNCDILLQGGNETSVAVSSNSYEDKDVKKYPLHIEHDEVGDVAKEYLRSETGCGEHEDISKDVSNSLSVNDEDGIVLEVFSSQTNVDSFLLESNSNNADIVRRGLSLQTQTDEVVYVDDASLQSENDEVVNIDVFPSSHQDIEEDVANDSFFDSENVPEDIDLDSENHHHYLPLDEDIDISSSGSKIISKSPNDETLLEEEDQDGGELKLKESEIAASDEYMEDDPSEIVTRSEPLSCVPKVVNGITSNTPSHPESWYHNDHEIEEDSSQAAEFEHLKFMLRKKELELARLKKLIEKEQLALSTLQSETEIKIKEAQQLILEKDAELQSAEETLSDLQEVEIQFHVDGESSTVELAGSFNGWHNRVKMDQSPSESSKLRSSSGVLWSTILWLYPGIYEIKFIVDGYWKLDPHRQVVTRGNIQNNILQVVGKR